MDISLSIHKSIVNEILCILMDCQQTQLKSLTTELAAYADFYTTRFQQISCRGARPAKFHFQNWYKVISTNTWLKERKWSKILGEETLEIRISTLVKLITLIIIGKNFK